MLVLGLVAQIMILWSHRFELFSHSEGFIVCVGEHMTYSMTFLGKKITLRSSVITYLPHHIRLLTL